MKIAFDTSVLVAGLLEEHPQHARARIWLQAVAGGSHAGVMSWHAVAEAWSVMTRLPAPLAVPAQEAMQALLDLHRFILPLGLDAETYRLALRRCTALATSSGVIFDALHLAAAELAGADLVLTFNTRDFRRLVEPGGVRVAAPPDPPSLELDSGG